jgi:hypothetical protein
MRVISKISWIGFSSRLILTAAASVCIYMGVTMPEFSITNLMLIIIGVLAYLNAWN